MDVLPALAVLAVVALVGLSIYWTLARSQALLDRWAEREGLRLLEVQRAWFWRGPFWLRSNQGHQVFRIRAEDDQGRTRRGYVRVGGWFAGILSDQVTVQWDDERV